MNSLIAINIFGKNGIINKDGIPILYYWDGKSDVKYELLNNNEFNALLEKYIYNTDNFGDAYISYIYYEDKITENYNTVKSLIQNFVSENIIKNMGVRYIMHHFNYLYYCSYKENYNFTDDFDNDIVNIYSLIKTKYPEKVAKKTVINYVRSELLQTNNLVTKNIDIIINSLENILKEKE